MPEIQDVPDPKKKKPPFPPEEIEPPGLEEEMKTSPEYDNDNYVASDKLKGKRALITGGDSGIGRAVALLFAKEGASVGITYLPEEEKDANKTMEMLEKHKVRAFSSVLNATDYKDCQNVAKEAARALGGIDILINNAAFQNHLKSIDDLDVEQFVYTFQVNVFGYFHMIKSVLPYMKNGGVIINTSSVLGYEGNKELIDYASTKGAIRTLTKSLAQALASRSIRVNSVAPGPVWTPLNPAERKSIEKFGANTLFKRPAQPVEIAPAYLYLASDVTSSYVTGETINLFGNTSGGN